MKIATFNINGIRGRLGNLLDWLAQAMPDVVCLQELRIRHEEFPLESIRKAGYGAIWQGQVTRYNGVAILSRGSEPVEVRRGLPDGLKDLQARYLEAAIGGVLIACLYAPNGNPQPGPKFDYKLAWHARFAAHAAELFATGLPVVLAGDYNIVPTSRDIYVTNSYDDNALVQPQSRAAFAQLLEQGWVDAIRALHPSATIYTFWDYMRKRWQRNAGLRIDHLLLSTALSRILTAAGVDKECRGVTGASDHVPTWVTVDLTSGEPRQKRAGKRGNLARSGD